MSESAVTITSIEQQLLSKEAISLPPKERLALLLKAKRYPIVRKKSSAKGQIEEMINFYNFCCFMLGKYFPNEQATNNFLSLNFLISKEDANALATNKLAEAFRLLGSYEKLENKITAIQMLFYQYQSAFPDIYQLYNLDDLANESVSDIVQYSKELISYDPSYTERLLERWGLS